MNNGHKNIDSDKDIRTKRNYSINLNLKNKQEDKKEQSSTLKRMISFLKKVYYNISKVIIVSTLLIGIGVLVTNYSVFPVIEKIFVKEEGSETTKETLVEMKGLNLNEDVVTEEEFKTIKNRIDSEIASIVLEQNIFKEGQSVFNDKMKTFYTQSYLDKVTTDDTLFNSLKRIYNYSYRYPFSMSLTSIGKVMKNDEAITKAVVDINAVDDDRGFHVTSLSFFFNDKYEIQDIKLIFEDKDYINTRTPIDSDSLISNSITNIMTREINKFIKDFNNKALYDKIQMVSLDINNSQMKSFFSNLDIQQKDYDVLSELFKLVKGNSKNISLIEYAQTDFDVSPLTNIILGVKTTEKIYKYNLQFDRNLEKLISISRI